MKPTSIIQRLVILLITLMSAIGANAQEAYANYTASNTTLTFYYDNLRSTRTGTTYDLNTGGDPGWYYDDTNANVTKVVFDPSFVNARPSTTYKWFSSMGNLVSITGINYLNTSEVTNMSWMFVGCSKLTSLDVSHFNTSKVISMYCMFESCSKLTSLDLSNFNTSQVKNMCGMFSECSSLTSLDLSQFNTSEVTEMWSMFMRCNSLTTLDLSTFNTSKVKDMTEMFLECNNLQTIYVGDGWNIGAISSAYDTFLACYNLKGGKGTAYDAKYVSGYFARIDRGPSEPGYLTDVSTRQAYAVYTEENTTLTFYYDNLRDSRTGTTYDLNTGKNATGWDTDGTKSSVTKVVFDPSFAEVRPTTTYRWFYQMTNLESIEGICHLNTSEVTNMFGMFGVCKKLTSLDLSGFNTAQVTDMGAMFWKCSELQTIYVGEGWSIAAVTGSSRMFEDCTKLKGGQGTKYSSSHVEKPYAHIDGGTNNPGYFSEKPNEAYACYTKSNATLTFYYDNLRSSRKGTTYDLNTGSAFPGWVRDDTNTNVTQVIFHSSFANVQPTSTYAWFRGMENLQSFNDMNYLNTSEVTNMEDMFFNCACLTSLDLSSFNTYKVTNMDAMFMWNRQLKTIYVGSGWNTDAVTKSDDMFFDCSILVGGKGTTYIYTNPKDKTYAHIDRGTSNPGYFTARNIGIATDLHQVTSVKSKVQSNEWYTIDGRKLNGMPAKKGVYIQNGQKRIIK